MNIKIYSILRRVKNAFLHSYRNIIAGQALSSTEDNSLGPHIHLIWNDSCPSFRFRELYVCITVAFGSPDSYFVCE